MGYLPCQFSEVCDELKWLVGHVRLLILHTSDNFKGPANT